MRTKLTLLLTLGALFVSIGAQAELPTRGTIGLYLAEGNDLARAGVAKVGEPFELVVVTDSDLRMDGVIFKITELNLLFPGIFKVSTTKYGEGNIEGADNDLGEYAFTFAGPCAEAGATEVARVGYVDANGELPNDIALFVGGIPNDTLHGPQLEGAPGFISCGDGMYALLPEPWDDDSIDPTQIEGVTTTDGLLVLNPSQQVPVGDASMTTLKARY